MLAADDVINLMARVRVILVQQAVLAAPTRALDQQSTENVADFSRQRGITPCLCFSQDQKLFQLKKVVHLGLFF